MVDCDHSLELLEPVWRLATNEDGWECLECNQNLGFRPDIDRAFTDVKVGCILLEFHEAKLIYVSNGTESMIITDNVTARCHAENFYDQKHILRFILEDPNMLPDSTFWRTRAERELMGAEPIRDGQVALPL